MSDLWYVKTSKRVRGPYETGKLRELAAEGRLRPDMLVSRDGKQTWVKASQLKGLEFGSKPAPEQPKRKRTAKLGENKDDDFLPQYGGAMTRRSRNVVENYGEQLAAAGDRTLARLGYAAFLGTLAASMVYLLVRVAYWFGWVRPETIGGSLEVRIGLPALAFVLAIGIAWWASRGGRPAIIDPDMTDEEIAEALKR